MDNISKQIKLIKKSRLIRFGLPFIIMMVGSAFGLRQFANVRYEYTGITRITKEQYAAYGLDVRPEEETTLEAIYEETMKNEDINNWENVRGPRPWEEDTIKENQKRQEEVKRKMEEKKKQAK